jgi:two-component system, chemotaxis family, chemotaxis protein CheY
VHIKKKPVFLVVDDSVVIRKMIITALRPLDAIFHEASSGLEALEQLMLQPVDMITLDLNMPDMHGLEFLQFVRNHQSFRGIPIIVVTTLPDEIMKEQALTAGANGFIIKPFAPKAILDKVSSLLTTPTA